jgi:DNA sulfur modification protein DndD
MKLYRLSVENFRQYYRQHSLEFAREEQHRVTVIHGINGAGKTTLFLAMNWCLYGKEVIDQDVIDLVSKEAQRQAQMGTLIRTAVQLTFTHEGQRYIVSRAIEGIKQHDETLSLYNAEEFVIERIGPDGQAKRVDSSLAVINAILPSNVRNYFLFNGERIDEFAKPSAKNDVRDAIYLVLRLEVLDRARKHLDDVAREYRKELKQSASDELRILSEKAEKARAKLEQFNNRKIEVDNNTQAAREKLEDVDAQLRKIESVSQLQQERERTEADLKQQQREFEKILAEIRTYATQSYIGLAQPAINRALAILDEKRQRGEIPSNVRQQFVQDLLESMVCICGRSFSEHGEEYQHLKRLMETSVSGSLEDEVLRVSSILHGFEARIQNQKQAIDHAMERRGRQIDRIKALEARVAELEELLRGSPLEDARRLARQREQFRADIEGYIHESGSLKVRIEQLAKEIDTIDKEIARAKKEAERDRFLSQKLNLANRSKKAIDQTYDDFANEMRQQIEAKTREIFKLLVWKESHFQNVQLGEDYYLDVIDRYGTPARTDLSAGERQVLSLSFIAAMAQVSGEEAPLVMDTPFGRLSSHHRNTITRHLPELASQLVLFVTDEELRDQARQNLDPYLGREYRLNFDHTTSCTEIEEES